MKTFISIEWRECGVIGDNGVTFSQEWTCPTALAFEWPMKAYSVHEEHSSSPIVVAVERGVWRQCILLVSSGWILIMIDSSSLVRYY